MTDEPDSIEPVELSEREAEALRSLDRGDAQASAALRARIVDSVRANVAPPRALDSPVPRWTPWPPILLTAAASFLAGVATNRPLPHEVPAAPSSTASPMDGSRYMLLLEGASSATADENRNRAREYGDWARENSRRGVETMGEELVGEPAVFPAGAASGGDVVGYFIVRAKSENEARAIAADNPHLQHGGRVILKALREPKARSVP